MSVRNFSVRNFLMMITCAVGLTAGWASSGWAQSTDISFGTAAPDRDEPIEVTAETLLINQDEGTAEYLGDVVIQQGDMRLTAPRVLIIYDKDASEIDLMEATGGVTIVDGDDEAEADKAVYRVRDGNVRMTGNVLLNQGINVLASNEMVMNLDDGTARILGRVRTVLTQNKDN